MMRIELDENQGKVLEILRKSKSMPFLELTSVSDFDDELLQRILDELEKKELVKLTNKGNPLEEIIIVRERAFAA